MNTITDNYIDNLQAWDEIQYDWSTHVIVRISPHDLHINIEWEIVEVSISEIAEEYEYSVLPNLNKNAK